MRYFISMLLVSSMLFLSCKKSNEEIVVNDGFTGKWQLISYGIGIGGTMQNPDPEKPEIIEFKSDSSFNANQHSQILKTFNAYRSTGLDKIKFSPDSPPNNWAFILVNNNLELYNLDCREGCIFEYKPVR